MDKEDEVFELVNSDDVVIGREYRGIVHRKGLLHRAVYCWVFNPQGQVLIQRRSKLKKIGPDQWDLSVAEHLQPGESFEAGAVRGLAEELGIRASLTDVAGPLQPTHKRELHQGEFHDVELVQSYRLDGYAGSVAFDDGEVSEARWIGLEELQKEVEAKPHEFTQWMREEGEALGWLKGTGGSIEQTRGNDRSVGAHASIALVGAT